MEGPVPRRAFTLIELMIVVVIIGVIAAIAIPKFAGSKAKAYETAMKSDLRSFLTAQLDYFATHQTYTTDITKLSFKSSTGVNPPVVTVDGRTYVVTISHSQLPGVVCAVAHNTTNPVLTSANSGEAACQ